MNLYVISTLCEETPGAVRAPSRIRDFDPPGGPIRLNTLSQSRGFDAVRRRGYVAGVPLVLCEVVRKLSSTLEPAHLDSDPIFFERRPRPQLRRSKALPCAHACWDSDGLDNVGGLAAFQPTPMIVEFWTAWTAWTAAPPLRKRIL